MQHDNPTTEEPAWKSNWHALADDLPMAVIITDSTGLVTTWSPEAERLYLWTAAEAVGTNIQDLTVGPLSVDVAQNIMENVLRGDAWEGEFTCRRRDGSTVEVHVIDLPVVGADGHIAGIVGLSFDVSTPRSTLRAEVDRIAEITSWVSRARQSERERIGRDLHDELGQLLTVLRTELLRTGGLQPNDVTAALQPLVDVVDTCLGELRRLCHDLRHEPLDLPGLAARIERATREQAARTGTCITFTVDPVLMHLDTPSAPRPSTVNAVWHIVLEALTNVERHADAPTATVWLGCDHDHLVGRVSDGGVGIWSLAEAESRGMGLNNMAERARAVGGQLTLQTGAGTTVLFRLPLVPSP